MTKHGDINAAMRHFESHLPGWEIEIRMQGDYARARCFPAGKVRSLQAHPAFRSGFTDFGENGNLAAAIHAVTDRAVDAMRCIHVWNAA